MNPSDKHVMKEAQNKTGWKHFKSPDLACLGHNSPAMVLKNYHADRADAVMQNLSQAD